MKRSACLLVAIAGATAADLSGQVEVAEASVAELQEAMTAGAVTSVDLTRAYLLRIVAYDRAGPSLNSVVTINPRALEEAAASDRERAATGPRGPLHGIPVVVKDNIDVVGLPTTAGTLALMGNVPTRDAEVVRRLRAAGAVILAKTNMHELASGATTVSSVAGQTLNPYDPSRTPGGSSGGTATAVSASFGAVGWGTDTCGSIRTPAAHTALFGLRPTLGRTPTSGVVPLARSHDVVAPIARTVPDLAVALQATLDPWPGATGQEGFSFVGALAGASLDGLRVGVLDEYFVESEEDVASQWIMERALDRMLRAGEGVTTLDVNAMLGSDPVPSERNGEGEPARLTRAGIGLMAALGADTVTVAVPGLDALVGGSSLIEWEFRGDFNDYLATSPRAPVRSLAELLADDLLHESLRERVRARELMDGVDPTGYEEARARRTDLRAALDSLFDAAELDVLVYPSVRRLPAQIGEIQRGSTCGLSSGSGWPAINVPVGISEEGLPVGMEVLGREGSDELLVGVAYALERAFGARVAPWSTPPLQGDAMPGPRVVDALPTGEADGVVSVVGDLVLSPALNRLSYDLRVDGPQAHEIIEVTLRVAMPAASAEVVHLLDELGEPLLSGTVTLTPALRRWLDEGALTLHVSTIEHPNGFHVAALRLR